MSAKKYPWSYVVFWLEGTLGHPGVVVLSHLTGGCARGAPGRGKLGYGAPVMTRVTKNDMWTLKTNPETSNSMDNMARD